MIDISWVRTTFTNSIGYVRANIAGTWRQFNTVETTVGSDGKIRVAVEITGYPGALTSVELYDKSGKKMDTRAEDMVVSEGGTIGYQFTYTITVG